MKFHKSLILASSALAGLFVANAATAQSTASQEEEIKEVVVTGGRKGIGALNKETGTKTKSTIDQGYISKQGSGQTILDTLNLAPGLNFTNNDSYGSSGGNVRLRGLDGSRVSLTFDGVQLNDSGNYAIYSNQQLEPELICAASVQTGATDVDSMTASATGGTINYNTCKPEDELGGVVKVAVGDEDMRYGFVRFDTGRFGPFGTKAFFAVTGQSYDTWTFEPAISDGSAKLQKNQYNFRIYQDLGDTGSFVSLAGHWNENRNHFMFGQSKANIARFGYGYNSINRGNINPSDTGNLRFQSKWVASEKLTLTADAAYQYVLANGGGNSTLREDSLQLRGARFSTVAFVDINGNGLNNSAGAAGSTTAPVTIYRPNTTNTNRVSLTTSAIYEIVEGHTLRAGASFDRANHRQTGEATLTNPDQSAINVFGGKEDVALRLKTADGTHWRRRDRFSEADVDVLSLEYRGRFIEDKLAVSLGFRNQKLERNLNQYCYSPLNGTGSFNPYCSTQPVTASITMADGNKVVTLGGGTTQYFAPFKRSVTFEKTLPNLGATWRFEHGGQLFASYAETLSSPRTDSFYAVIFKNKLPSGTGVTQAQIDAAIASNSLSVANPSPETSEIMEIGYRYSQSNFSGSATIFMAKDDNRIVESYDPDSDTFFDRNVGKVDRNGFEAQIAFTPVEKLTLQAGMTYTDTEVKNDLIFGETSTGAVRLLPTAGKQLVETPKWMFTGGMDFQILENLLLNMNAKYVGERFSTDVNDDKAPDYVVFNSSLRYDLPWFKEGTYVQLNVSNLFDEQYFGNIGTQNNFLQLTDNTGATKTSSGSPSFNMGAPRTVSIALRAAF